MSRKNSKPTAAPVAPGAPVADPQSPITNPQSPAPAPAPVEFAGKPQGILSLCNIAGHAWRKHTTPDGRWTYSECSNPECGRRVEVKRAK